MCLMNPKPEEGAGAEPTPILKAKQVGATLKVPKAASGGLSSQRKDQQTGRANPMPFRPLGTVTQVDTHEVIVDQTLLTLL